MFSFNLKAPIADIDDTGGDEPVHPAKIVLLEWDEDHITQVLVPLDVFEPYRDALQVGTLVSIVGQLHEVPGGKWHVATSLRIAGKKH